MVLTVVRGELHSLTSESAEVERRDAGPPSPLARTSRAAIPPTTPETTTTTRRTGFYFSETTLPLLFLSIISAQFHPPLRRLALPFPYWSYSVLLLHASCMHADISPTLSRLVAFGTLQLRCIQPWSWTARAGCVHNISCNITACNLLSEQQSSHIWAFISVLYCHDMIPGRYRQNHHRPVAACALATGAFLFVPSSLLTPSVSQILSPL